MPVSVDGARLPAIAPAALRPRRRRAALIAALGIIAGAALALGKDHRAVVSALGGSSVDPSGNAGLAALAHAGDQAPEAAMHAAMAAPMRIAATPVAEPPVAPSSAASSPDLAPSAPDHPRADAHLQRTGYAHVPQGIVFVPSTFSSADGAYDLLLHFHGNTRVVLESAEHAGLDAIVAVVNIGKNSAPYLDYFAAPDVYEQLLGDIGRALAERGLDHAEIRRVALSAWSGGYGALSRILEHGRGLASLDAVLVLDGIHCGYVDEGPSQKKLNALIISPFLTAAKQAAEGKFLFSITHSEIDPVAYAGTAVTADYLLEAVGGHRGAPAHAPEHLALRAAEGAVAKRLEKRMDPASEATVGAFHVRGYRGNTPEHHMAHLLQMGATVMPELAQRWRKVPPSP